MGFGLLLCAYFLLTIMSVGIGDYCFATYIIGAMIAIRAAGSLKDYCVRFKWLMPVAGVYGLLAIYFAVLCVDDLFLWGLPLRGPVIAAAVDWVQFLAECSFAVITLWAVMDIAGSVGLDKHRAAALRNLIFVGMWGVGQVALLVAPRLSVIGNQALVKVLLLYVLIIYLLNSLLLYRCFSSICPKGEEFGKPSKPSRFAFMNAMDRKLDEKNEQARLEYERDLEKKQNQKYSAKNNHRHHKKKK